jgi:hypothetical protein
LTYFSSSAHLFRKNNQNNQNNQNNNNNHNNSNNDNPYHFFTPLNTANPSASHQIPCVHVSTAHGTPFKGKQTTHLDKNDQQQKKTNTLLHLFDAPPE